MRSQKLNEAQNRMINKNVCAVVIQVKVSNALMETTSYLLQNIAHNRVVVLRCRRAPGLGSAKTPPSSPLWRSALSVWTACGHRTPSRRGRLLQLSSKNKT